MKANNGNKKIIRLGMAQVDCALGDVKTNIEKAIGYIEDYNEKVDLLIFPELSITGYGVGEDFHKYALRLDDQKLKKLIDTTKNKDLTVGVGLIEETPSFNFYNSFVYISKGEIIHTHRKIYLPNYGIFEEKKYFAKGAKYECFEDKGFLIGPFICGDAWNPALAHLAAANEANLFIFPACSPDRTLGERVSNKKGWQQLIRFYGMVYGSYVAFVNRVGSERDLEFYGKSTLVNPFGKVVAMAEENKEGVTIGTLNLKMVREARTILNTMRDEDLRFVQKEVTRTIDRIDYL